MRTLKPGRLLLVALLATLISAPALARAAAQESARTGASTAAKPATDTDATETRVFRLQYAEAASLAQILQPILAAQERSASRVQPAEGETAPAGRARSTFTITADVRTNCIIAAGSRASLETVQELIAALDVASTSTKVTNVSRAGAVDAKRLPVTSYRLDITVFQVAVAPAKATEIEAETLESQAKTPAALQTALQGIGTTKLLYRFDRAMVPGRPARLEATASVPFVTAETRAAGQPQLAVSREQLGARFDVFAEPIEENPGQLRLSSDGSLSLVTQQDLPGDSPRTIPVVRKMSASFEGLTEVGKPAVFISVDTNTTGDEAGTALVVRVLVTQN